MLEHASHWFDCPLLSGGWLQSLSCRMCLICLLIYGMWMAYKADAFFRSFSPIKPFPSANDWMFRVWSPISQTALLLRAYPPIKLLPSRSFGILLWEVMSQGSFPYTELSDAEVVATVCQHQQRLLQPVDCPDTVWVQNTLPPSSSHLSALLSTHLQYKHSGKWVASWVSSKVLYALFQPCVGRHVTCSISPLHLAILNNLLYIPVIFEA